MLFLLNQDGGFGKLLYSRRHKAQWRKMSHDGLSTEAGALHDISPRIRKE